jgi:hypothetical protein
MPSGRELARFLLASSRVKTSLGFTVTGEAAALGEASVLE